MTIWLTRHGQTNLNKQHLMQGRTDEPLNETGRAQARAARAQLGDMHFDAVYASPLQRAIETGAIMGDISTNPAGFFPAALIMCAVLVVSLVVGVAWCPDTQGKTLDQITEERYGKLQ